MSTDDRPGSSPLNAGEINARLCSGVVRFEKEIMGRGPEEVRAYLVEDLVILRLKGVLTPAEMSLVEGGGSEREIELVKEFRQKLIERNRDELAGMVAEVTGRRVRSIHTDLDTRTGERIIICVTG